MKKCFILILIIVTTLPYFSQTKELTVEDVTINSYSKFYLAPLTQISWRPGTKNYTYTKDYLKILESSPYVKEDKVLIDKNELNKVLKENKFEEIKYIANILWLNENEIALKAGNKYIKYNLKEKYISPLFTLPKDAQNISISPDKKNGAYTKGQNLFATINDKEIEITSDTTDGLENGKSVHRNEFGITKGIFWSPKNSAIAFYHKDETMVAKYPIINYNPTPAIVAPTRYPMAGQKSHQVKIGIYNIASQKIIYLETGEPKDQYLTCVTWGPEEKYLYTAILNREQNWMQLVKFDATTGKKVKVLFEEKDEQYVEPEHHLIFLPEENDKFLWFSERDGYDHLYLYNTEGKLLRQVTKGTWVVLSFEGFDSEGENIFISATKETPLENNFYKVNLRTSKIQRITPEGGHHNLIINNEENLYIDVYSNTTTPRKTVVLNEKGKAIKTLQDEKNPLSDYNLGKFEFVNFKNKENIDLYGQIFYPPNFDPEKKYPAIVYVYGGPHAQLVTNHWPVGRYDLWFLMMAQKGYIVFQMDNRGSANRGAEFEQAVHRQLGTKEIEDQLAGVEYLKSLGFVDMNRLGVWGWSFGGFMTTSLMLRTNDTFKVGVAGGAVIDWKYYEVMYGERYMDTPEENPEGYKNASPLTYIDNLHGKLLLVHGTSDPTVVPQNVYMFTKTAANYNKPLDFYPYTGHGHGVGGKDALHLYNKITNYFLDNL